MFKGEEEKRVKCKLVLLLLGVSVWKKMMGCSAVSKWLLIQCECSSPEQRHIMFCVCVCLSIDPDFLAVPLNGFCLFGERPGLNSPGTPVLPVPETSSTPAVATSPWSTEGAGGSSWRYHCSLCLVSSLTQLLNETPDESVLTDLTWVYGCCLSEDQGEVLSVS